MREIEINRKTSSPESDIDNILAGYHSWKKDEKRLNTIKFNGKEIPLEKLHALPQSDGSVGATDIFLKQRHDQYETALDALGSLKIKPETASAPAVLLENIFKDAVPHDAETLATVYEKLVAFYLEKPPKEPVKAKQRASKPFDRILRFMVLKKRIQFEKDYPIHIEPGDTPQQINNKIKAKNQLFQNQTNAYKKIIFGIINAKLPESAPRINSNAIERVTNEMNRSFLHAAKLDGKFRAQKKEILKITEETANNIINQASPNKANEYLEAKKEKLQERLKVEIQDKLPAGSAEQTAFKWKVEESRLTAKYNRNPTPSNAEALSAHKTKRPADYDEQEESIQESLQKARPLLYKIATIEQKQEAIQPNILAHKVASLENKLKNKLQNLLNDKGIDLSSHEGQAEWRKLQEDKEYARLIYRYDNKKTTENKNSLLNFAAAYGYKEGKLHSKYRWEPTEREEIKRIAKLENDYAEENQGKEVKDTVGYKLAIKNLSYAFQLIGLNQKLKDKENPHPTELKIFQKQMFKVCDQHEKDIDHIHSEYKTDRLLRQISRPLDALRDNWLESWSATLRENLNTELKSLGKDTLGIKFPRLPRFGNYLKESARLPVLSPEEYHLNESPKILNEIKAITNNVNGLLQEREILECSLQGNPEIAKSAGFRKELEENTRQLERKMKTLTSLTNRSKSYLKAHPNVAEFAQKASRLQDAVNRKHFLQRHAFLNSLAGVPLMGNGLNPISRAAGFIAGKLTGGRHDPVAGIDPNLKFDPNAGRQLENQTVFTKYYVQDGIFKWRLCELKTSIKHKDPTSGEEYNVMEEVQFNKAELMGHFEDFCKEHNVREGVKLKETSSEVTITWPRGRKHPTEHKEKWLEYLREKYQEKRAKELNIAEAKAKVDIKHDPVCDPSAIRGAPPSSTILPPTI